jgi:tetratricopeptide (TPR) repeat protein
LAKCQTGQLDDGIALLEESLEMARGSGDRSLLGRCYINIPMTRFDRGDPPSEIGPVFEEGLELARRAGAVATAGWIAANLSYELGDLGRLDESVALATESIEACVRAGDDERVAQARESLIWGYLLRGDRELATHEWADLLTSAQRNTEGLGWTAVLEAVLDWTDDPQRAYERLVAVFEGLSPEEQSFGGVARNIARMALRLDDRHGLVRAANAFLGVSASGSGPIALIRSRWFAGLASDPDGSDVEAAADALEAVGYRTLAAYAYADAAILAARAGRPSESVERATAIAAAIGLHPHLGPLPETRWLTAQATTS